MGKSSKGEIRPLKEQVVVVFGASSGIGRITARQFAEKGAKVVVSARGKEGLESLVAEITEKGGEAYAIPADAVSFEEVRAVAEATVERYGRIDTWAHVAAVTIYATFEQTTPEEFAQIIDVNLLGQVHGAKAALPYLTSAPNGAFISISSVESQISLPYNSAYAASKHGVHGWIEAMRMELHHENRPVRVTEIMPASIDTPLFSHAETKLGVKPMGIPPIYPPEMVADAILHAATHDEREIVVGGAGKAMLASKRLAPELTDKVLEKVAFRGQKTMERRSPDAPNNLFSPEATQHREHGDYGGIVIAGKVLQWALLGAALGTAAVLASHRGGGNFGTAYRTAYRERHPQDNPDAYTDSGDGTAAASGSPRVYNSREVTDVYATGV
jgi:short-subunit dehydrogenase